MFCYTMLENYKTKIVSDSTWGPSVWYSSPLSYLLVFYGPYAFVSLHFTFC